MDKLVAAIPNISEGEDIDKVRKIVRAIETNKNLKLLNVHSFKDYNRTQVYYMGSPEEVLRGSIDLARNAFNVLDMSLHTGGHLRIGAIDVLPFIPIKNVDIDQCVKLAHDVGRIIGERYRVPVFYYKEAAKQEKFKQLSKLRNYEYEGLKELFENGKIIPDDGPREFNNKTGAIAIGARYHTVNMSIAVNTNNLDIASKVARELRSSGYVKDGVQVQGKLQEVKANVFKPSTTDKAMIEVCLTNNNVTPLHLAYIEFKRALENLNYDIEYAEIQTFLFKNYLIDAGRYFLTRKNKTLENEQEIIEFALEEMKIRNFNIKKRIIEA